MNGSAPIARRWWAVLVGALMQLWPRPSQAAPLSFDEVLASIDRTHPGVEAARRDVDVAAGKALAARGGFDPHLAIRGQWAPLGYYQNAQVDALVRQPTPAWGIGLYAGYRVGWGSYPVYRGDLQTLSGGEVRAGIDVPIWKDGLIDARRAAIAQSRVRRDGAEDAADATRLEVERKAAEAYWTWVAAGQSLEVARDLLALAERRDAGLNEQAAAGAIERIALVDNRRLVLDRMAKVVEAERKFAKASLDLSLFLRDDRGNPVRATEERVPPGFPEPHGLDRPDLADEVARALQRRPDLDAVRAQSAAAQVAVRLAKNQRAPGVNLQSFVAKDFGEGPDELAPTEFGVGVTVQMPLPLRQARGELAAARAEVASVDADLRGLRDRIAMEVRAAHVALEASRQQVELARRQVEAATELAEAERVRLAEGASDLVIVNLRELAAADAANQQIEALAEFQRAHAAFLVSTGRSPTG